MKQFLYVPALALLLLTSCNDKEEKETVTLNEKTEVKMKLEGEWSNNYRTSDYYNDAGEIAHEDTATVDVRFKFNGGKMSISHPGVEGETTFNYALPDTSNTNYVVISKNGQVQDYWEIKSLNDTAMVWSRFLDYAGYQDANNNTVTSRRGVFTYKFKKM